jgi:hypothetical protein
MIDKLIKDFIDKSIIELKKKENKDRIELEILNPIFSTFTERIYPYVSLLFLMYCIDFNLFCSLRFSEKLGRLFERCIHFKQQYFLFL